MNRFQITATNGRDIHTAVADLPDTTQESEQRLLDVVRDTLAMVFDLWDDAVTIEIRAIDRQ